MAKKVIDQSFAVALDGTKTAEYNIDVGTGNLAVGVVKENRQELVSGIMQYLEKQEQPTQFVNKEDGVTIVRLHGSNTKQAWKRFPWSSCNGATEWIVNLNPNVQSKIKAHSEGGNIRLDLIGIVVGEVEADTGGGNINLTLSKYSEDFSMRLKSGAGNVMAALGGQLKGKCELVAESGAGNVEVRLPEGAAACIHASSGWGKLNIHPGFTKIDDSTYQSSTYEAATDKIDLSLKSGAGDVIVSIG